MNFCPRCGQPVALRIPDNDIRERHVCTGCGTVHYQNPTVIVSCLATLGQRALWMRRADEPRRGFWSVPGGFMEIGESLQEAAARELREETGVCLSPAAMNLYGVGSVGNGSQVYVSFRAELQDETFAPGPESLEVALFSREALPVAELAYPGILPAVDNFYRELAEGRFGIYLGDYSQIQKMLERLG